MYPIIFLGALAFMFSTLIKNGNGTAVVMILIGVALIILADALARTQWNVFLNPFDIPDNLNEVIWQGLITKNRMFLGIGIIVFVLYGLFNLQKRERFV
jgi:ABC-type transport system involved in multi-copper enzyme maturation permease subunit